MPTPSILLIPDRYKAAVLYSQIPDSGAVDFDVTRATTAFRTNASGVLESVASGVPRLDYPIGGGCPSLLVEPAATNLFLRSEEFLFWTKIGVVVTDDVVAAPNGTTTADRAISVGGNNFIYRNVTVSSGTTYTLSFYLRADSAQSIRLYGGGGGIGNSSNISIGTTWQRYSYTFTTTSAGTFDIGIRADSGLSAFDIYVWGAQLETGSVATSYIPTVAATATRNADVISKTGVSGFIGQTEGSLYAEVDTSKLLGATARTIFAIETGTSRVSLSFTSFSANTLRAFVRETNVIQYDARTTITTTGIIKLAIAYKSLDSAFYVNGVQITNVLTDLSFGSINFSDVLLGSADTNFINDRIRAAAIYTTRLSNAELAALTTL